MSEKSEMTVDKTGVITYYAVTFDEIDYTVIALMKSLR